MIISREFDYALRILRHLSNRGLSSAVDIEKSENVTADFARKILRKLRKAGIVQVERGVNGGYRLIKSCDELTLWDIKCAIEPEEMVNRCVCPEYQCDNLDKNLCAIHFECCRLENIIKNEMENRKLSEIFGL